MIKPNAPSFIEINNRNFAEVKMNARQRVRTFKTRYQETDCLETEIATNQIEPFNSEISRLNIIIILLVNIILQFVVIVIFKLRIVLKFQYSFTISIMTKIFSLSHYTIMKILMKLTYYQTMKKVINALQLEDYIS